MLLKNKIMKLNLIIKQKVFSTTLIGVYINHRLSRKTAHFKDMQNNVKCMPIIKLSTF